MSLPISFRIKESLKELQKLLKDSSAYLAPRLKMLIECKKHESTGLSKRVIAETIGVNPNSVQKWRGMYIAGGIKAILTHNKTGYKPSLLSQSDHEKIKEKLHNEKNPIKGFVELQQWIMEELGKDIRYTTVFGYAKRHFGAKVKVSRKSHIHKDKEAVDDFKKNFSQICQKAIKEKQNKYSQVNLYCQDESRFGLFTRNGKALTAKGVKPICSFQQKFQSLFVFGAFSPINGNQFVLEMPQCNSDAFQIFLNELSEYKPEELKLMILDNGAFHKAKKLIIPDNIVLIFIPPYSPELNPAEKVWWKWKRNFTNRFMKTLDEVSEFIKIQTTVLSSDSIKKLCGFNYIFSCNYWTTI